MDTSVWWSADLFSAMRATLSADRSREHLEAHARGETVVHNQLRAEDVVRWATIGGARALGLDSLVGSVTPGKRADLVLIKNDDSPAMYPLLHPYGSVVYQAGRGDVHTVLVNGQVVKHEHRLAGVYLRAAKEAVGADGRVRTRHDGRRGVAGRRHAGTAGRRARPEPLHLHRL